MTRTVLLDPAWILGQCHVAEGMRVADFGCGSTGNFLFPLARIVGSRGKVYAVDVVKSVLDNIKKRALDERFDNIETVWSDLEKFGAAKIESGSLDAGVFSGALYQMKNRPEALRESSRMLKKGGRLVVVEWKSISAPFGPDVNIRLKPDLLMTVASRIGLTTIDRFDAGPYHYCLVFEKI